MAFMLMLVVLYAFLFGGAMRVPGGGNYLELIIPGLAALNVVWTPGLPRHDGHRRVRAH